MSRVERLLVLRWIVTFGVIAITIAVGFATAVSVITYLYKGLPSLNPKTWSALGTIWNFWLWIGYGVGMIGAVVISLKNILYRCIEGSEAVLLNCKGDEVEQFEWKPYFKLWRQWFFALIWLNAAQAIILIALHKLIVGGALWFGWFSGVGMGIMMSVSGALAVVITIRRSSRVRVRLCS